MKAIILGVVFSGLVIGQKPEPSLAFEVASVKQAATHPASEPMVPGRLGCSGGPGTPRPGQYTCFTMPVEYLLDVAFGLKDYQYKKQVTIDSPRYDIVAKVPQGATKEQLSVMLQNLLIQRFKLAWHYEKKEIPVYDLVVGKNGPKLKQSPPLDPKAADGVPPAPVRPPLDPDGLPLLLARRNSTANFIGHNGTTRRTLANDSTMEQLANLLSSRLQRPVINATGLKGKYDYVLTYTGDPARGPIMDTGGAPPPPPSDAPTIFAAVQEQLGLKLEQKKGMVDTFVVDHLEKTPIGN